MRNIAPIISKDRSFVKNSRGVRVAIWPVISIWHETAPRMNRRVSMLIPGCREGCISEGLGIVAVFRHSWSWGESALAASHLRLEGGPNGTGSAILPRFRSTRPQPCKGCALLPSPVSKSSGFPAAPATKGATTGPQWPASRSGPSGSSRPSGWRCREEGPLPNWKGS